jgi:hypothetical protein
MGSSVSHIFCIDKLAYICITAVEKPENAGASQSQDFVAVDVSGAATGKMGPKDMRMCCCATQYPGKATCVGAWIWIPFHGD